MRRLSGSAWARIRVGLTGAVILAFTGLGVSALLLSQDTTNELVGVGGGFVGLAGLAISLTQLPSSLTPSPPVTELADLLAVTVREQWESEVTARRLRDPRVIPLTWSATERPVSGPPDSIVGPVNARVLRLVMSGRLDGSFQEAARRLAEGYRRVPSGRLVVLGEPGAGKSVLAIMLVLGLLRERSPHAPVPVLLAVSTWDPVSESLDDWMVDSLATAHYGGRPDIPRRLLDQHLLLPVLDGLDEIPEVARRSAVRAINHACGDGRGVVLTCRSTEYQDVIEAGSPVLRRAPVVEVRPVMVSDAVAYLEDTSWPTGVDWEPVYQHLRDHPTSPLASALSTPLLLSLARTVYRHCRRDPRELLDFDSQHAAEDHILDHVVAAAYAPPPSSAELPTNGAWERRAEQAERRLTYLATYLHRYRERDLAWWLMRRRLMSRWFGVAVGIALGLAVLIAVVVTTPLISSVASSRDIRTTGYAVGGGTAILAMLTWYAALDPQPGRLSFTFRGSVGRLRRGSVTGLALVAVPALPLLATAGTVITLTAGWSDGTQVAFVEAVSVVLAAAVAFAVAFGVHNWLDAPPERSTGASPLGLLGNDRASALVGSAVAGAVLGLIALPLALLALSLNWMALHSLAGPSRQPALYTVVQHFLDQINGLGSPLTISVCMVLPAAIFTMLILLTRAWTGLVLLRMLLAVRGQLPWRLMRFLADARDRQLLRQSAGTYQFRHIRLQERLANRSLALDRAPRPRTATLRRRGIRLAAACVALTGGALVLTSVLPPDSSRTTILTGDVEAMVFSADGRTLFTIDGDRIRGWDTASGRQTDIRRVRTMSRAGEGRATSMGVREDGTIVVVFGEANSGWWMISGSGGIPSALPDNIDDSTDPPVVSGDGNYLAYEDEDGALVQNLRTGEIRHFRGYPKAVAVSETGSLVSSVDGGYVIVTSTQNTPYHCSPAVSRSPVCQFIPGDPGLDFVPRADQLVTVNADATLFATSTGGAPRVRKPNGKELDGPYTGPYDDVRRFALSPEGDMLADTAGGVTRLWQVRDR